MSNKMTKTTTPARPIGILHFVRRVESSVFFKGKGAQKVADYSAIFVDAVHEYLKSKNVKHDRPTLVAVASHVNLSSFQRAAANESRRRGGVRCQAVPEKVSRVKPVDPATGEKVKTKRKPAVDPIDGTPVKRAAKLKALAEVRAGASKVSTAVSKRAKGKTNGAGTAAKLKAGMSKPAPGGTKAREAAQKPEVQAEVEF